MKVVIDTCSLLSMVRYYLPFDTDSRLLNLFKTKIEAGELIVIDRIYEECQFVSQGLILEKLSFLKNKKELKSRGLLVNTEFMLAPSPDAFMAQVENQFTRRSQRKLLNDVEYESRKTAFMKTADMGMILYCLTTPNDPELFGEKFVIVTEETENSNDSKLFHKIPVICKILGISTMTLPELLEQCPDIEVLLK